MQYRVKSHNFYLVVTFLSSTELCCRDLSNVLLLKPAYLHDFTFFISRLRRLVQVLLVFISSPLCIIFAMSIIHDFLTVETGHYEVMKILKTYPGDFLSTLQDSFLLGTWTYPVTVLVVFPNWLLFWSIAWM